ncbi:MAG TPA: O-antigen ligase family protein [Candidatus Binatia bacterium]
MGLQLPPSIASCLTVAFIIFLFRRDIRQKPDVSGALWLPFIWLMIPFSRALSQWLNIFGLPVSGGVSVEEGSPLDAWFFFALIAAGSCVLVKRQVSVSEVIQNNGWLIVFVFYCFISIAWSDFPSVAFKRWIKILGHPIMALIILTEPNPDQAVKTLLKRCAYLVVPVSILFIKYYPKLGRAFDEWGSPMNTGITQNKNSLGSDGLILGFFFFWYLLQIWQTERSTQRRNELRLIAGFLIGILYLLRLAHSATPATSLCIGVLVVLFVGSRLTNKNFIGTYLLTALVLLVVAELTFGISSSYSEALGRGSGLSGRTLVWSHLLEVHINPVLGTGFESFWLAKWRVQHLEGLFFYSINEAHNGYLETYLNLGLIGLFLLIVLFVATFWKIRLELFRNFEWARFRLGFLAAVILYNWTEAAFRTVSAVWFIFFLIAMDYPRSYLASAQSSVGLARSEEDREFAYVEGRS